ncbi:MAG: hypothetical protein OEY77_03330 [Nitrospira sp.]|nr:hypothetical protein [Nitrospira sp.]
MKQATLQSHAVLLPSPRLFGLAKLVLISFALISLPVQAAPPPDKTPRAPAFELAPTNPTTGLENTPIRTKPLSSNAVGTLSPESGKWHSFVTVKGPNFAKAERVAVLWYPHDDASNTASGSVTATLRKRVGTDEIEIEMPRDAGGASGGVVRVYVFMPNQLQPVLAGRFTVNEGLAVKGRAGSDVPVKDNKVQPRPAMRAPEQLAASGTPVSTTLTWKYIPSNSGDYFTVYRSPAFADAFTKIESGIERVNARPSQSGNLPLITYGIKDNQAVDPRRKYHYLVTVENSNTNAYSEARLTYQPPEPANPEELRARELHDANTTSYNLTISWGEMDGADAYSIEASPSLGIQEVKPQAGKKHITVSYRDIPPGTYTFRVGAIYGTSRYQSDVSKWTSKTIPVGPTYHVDALGFQVQQQTQDDPLQRDGKGDEVYLTHSARIVKLDMRSSTESIATKILGDVNGFSAREKAGSASDKGGIVSGDYIGVRHTESGVTRHGFPVRLFTSTDHTGIGYVNLIVWEVDKEKPSMPKGMPQSFERLIEGGLPLQRVASEPSAPLYQVGTETCAKEDVLDGNRPIGLQRIHGKEALPCLVLKFDPEWVRAELARTGGELPAGVFKMDVRDAVSGHYTIYMKITQ